ncbi:FecR family protein [Sunxiuqinia sp. A32]|uniref:FecR family protein n=1 Tax=Sunxiuqinia sp. A32 TaxID=3461496 RepID=UPI0040456F4E
MKRNNNSFIRRYFSNKYSRNDYLNFKDTVLNKPIDLEENLGNHWRNYINTSLLETKELSKVKSFVNAHIDRENKGTLSRKIYVGYSRIAAILLVPIVIALGVLYFQFNEFSGQMDTVVELSSPSGAQTQLNLPDGSLVWLNGNSSIKYPAVFKGNRIVEVTGEAFFKVKSGRGNPFLVSAKNMFVKATGTEFNVNAYDDKAGLDVILKEGKVSILNSKRNEIKKMESGFHLHYQEGKSYTLKKINANNYADWINGKLVFENAPFKEVVERLEHRYGVNIELQDQELESLHFKATFTKESIDLALRLLKSTATFKYRFEQDYGGETKIVITKF